MALSERRIHRGRATPYPWERQALDLVYKHESLSDTDPHQAWELHELYDPSSGRLYEIDLLFLSRQGLFLVEIKSHPGMLTGDIVDWTITDGGRRRTIECPYPGANLEAKILADLLERHLGQARPYVHAAVFLSNVTDVQLDGDSSPALFIRDLVADGARRLGVAIGDLHKWTPPATTRRTTVDPSEVLAALQSWRLEVDEDEDGDEEAEQPEGPTEADLASEVGVTKALITKALEKLEADGLVEKPSGRPARYVATGDGA